MPQGFPDPYSSFSSGFRQSFFPILQIGMQQQREKRIEETAKQELELRKQAAFNTTVMNAFKVARGGATDLAREMLESTGKFQKGIAGTKIKQFLQLPEEMQMAVDQMKEDDPVGAALLGRVALMDPKEAGTFFLKLKERQEFRAAREVAGGREPKTAAAPSAPRTALAESQPPIAPILEVQGAERGGLGSTALAQRLLEGGGAQTQVPGTAVAPTVPAPSPTTPVSPPEKGAETLYDLPIEVIRRREAQLRQIGSPPAVKFADNLAKIAEAKIKTEEKSEVYIRKIERIKTEARQKTLDRIEKEAAAHAKGSEKPLSRIRDEAYERAMGTIEAQEGQPKSPLGRMLFDRDAAKKSGNQAAVAQHETAIDNYLSDVRKDTLAALTAYKEGRYGDVKPYLSGIPIDELRAMSIDPVRAMMGLIGQRKEETGKAVPTMGQLATAEKRIQRMIQALPSATEAQLHDTLKDNEKILSGFPKEQKDRVIKLIRDELKARADRAKKAGAGVR